LTRILIAAGASGGHVYPALATAEVLRSRGNDVSFAGGDRLEATVIPQAGFPFHGLPVRRPPSVRIELLTPHGIGATFSIARAIFIARKLIRELRPDVVVGMGGFAAVPVTLAARRTKLVLHEQNAHLSLAQRLAVRSADVLALGFPIEERLPHVRTEVVGQPVRKNITRLATMDDDERAAFRADARASLGLDPDAPLLFVFGGSLGSGPLNESVPRAQLPDGVQVLHLAGKERDAPVRDAWNATGRRAVVLPYLEIIETAYAAADVVVARAGASSVAEFAIAGLPSILVPLPTLRRGDQEANARVMERAGAAVVVMQSEADFVARIGQEASRLLADPSARRAMSAAARSIARPDAAERLADVIETTAAAP
jgi:UDP-N-acetylglucosamine--N-acetylmuramyl-(pentapeptide) pyrophosphoryl-undecaprenol N-acetylglucosamine transferase